MSVTGKPLRLTPIGLVLMPLAMACVITGVAVLAVGLNERVAIVDPGSLITATILVYSAILLFLGRSTMATPAKPASVNTCS